MIMLYDLIAVTCLSCYSAILGTPLAAIEKEGTAVVESRVAEAPLVRAFFFYCQKIHCLDEEN